MNTPYTEEAAGNVLQSMTFRLAYGDCDPLGIVYYAAYYPLMERVYNEWVFQSKITPDMTKARWGIYTVMRSSGCEYLTPGRLYDAFDCQMALHKSGRTSFTMGFRMLRTNDGTPLAIGHMSLVTVGLDGKPRPLQPDHLATLKGTG